MDADHYAEDGHTRDCPSCGDPFHPHKLVCARCGRQRPPMFGEEPTLADLRAQDGNGIAYDEKGWHDAGLDVHWAWERLTAARTITEQASAVVEMNEAMAGLSTWLPGYNYRTGEVTDPREED